MAIRRTSAATTINRGVSAAAATPVNIITGSGGTGSTVNISSIQIANSEFTVIDDTAVSTAGGFLIINGTGFQSGATVRIQGTAANSVAFVSSSRLNVTVPAISSGTLDIYVINPDGSGAILISGFVSSGTPTWTTTSPLTGQDIDTAFSIQLEATSDSSVTYALTSGSTLPPGTTLASNGRFSGTVTGIEQETTYTFSVDAIDSQNQETVRSFNITVNSYDQYYYLTTLHLSGETPANTWISDASANSFAITVNGDTRPMAFSPYETVWSNYFDGTGDYLSIAPNALNDLSGDFTVEAWIYRTVIGTLHPIFDLGDYQGASGILFYVTSGNALAIFTNNGLAMSGGTIPATNWTHVALVRSGSGSGNIKLYLNGVSVGTPATSTATFSGSLLVGADLYGGATTNFMNGYISNLRVLKGTALYTSNFTPSTSPLTAIANTSLLTCQSNRLIDVSNNNFTLTRNGDVLVSNFGPFTETDLVTGSAYFDGTGDYLTVPTNVALDFGTGNFTVEFWWYPTSLATDQGFLGGGAGCYDFVWRTSTGFNLGRINVAFDNTFAFSPVVNTWYHVAYSRSGTSLRVFVNGTQVGSTATNSISYVTNGSTAVIGGSTTVDRLLTGYISNLRLVKGTAVYTADFTPPTSPLTAVANTSLLTLQNRFGENNNRIIDTSGINSVVTRNGNVTQGTFSPFSQNGWSNYFDGSSTLYFAGAPISTTQTNFTIEAWVYLTADPTFGGGVGQVVVDGGGLSGGSYWGFGLNTSRNIVFRWYDGASGFNCTSTSAVPLNQWAHIAVSVSSNAIKLFINGNLQSTTGTSTLTNRGGNQGNINVGRYATTDALFGYISNARIVTGAGLYSTSFTPSTTPLTTTVSSGTVAFLTAKSNRFEDNSTGNRTPVLAGSPSIQAFSPFKASDVWSANTVGGSMSFDGTGDYLTVPDNAALESFTDFTIEFWVYFNSVSGTQVVVDKGWNGGSFSPYLIFLSSGSLVAYASGGSSWDVIGGTSFGTMTAGQWYHIALTRSGSSIRFFRNGTIVNTLTNSTALMNSASALGIGASPSAGASPLNGYISNLRIIKGAAAYTANTSPPTAPVSSIANTTLLLSGSNSGIIDYTSRNSLETVGNVRLRSDIVKYGNASLFFDGTGDYVVSPYSPNLNFDAGNFTVEFWMNPSDVNASYKGIVGKPDLSESRKGWALFQNGNTIRYFTNSSSESITTSSCLTAGAWTHIALVKNGSTTTIYANGTSVGTETNIGYTEALKGVAVGEMNPTVGWNNTFSYTGYIDDLRITKGVARYTSNFTAPTSAFKLR